MGLHLGSGLALALGLLSMACNDVPAGCDHYITPGDDDQTAIQEVFVLAEDGDTVCLAAGTFTLTDPLEVSSRSDFTLRGAGMDETTLDFSGQTAGGTGIDMMNMTRLLVEDLAIMDAVGNGLRIIGSNDVVVRRVRAGWTPEQSAENGKYAIYPVSSTNVLVEDSEATNSSDAGFYMGQTENCVMRNNVARGNVAAYEVENSINCEVYGNLAEGNVGGILVFELPGLELTGGGTYVHDNEVRDNNLDNFAGEGIVALLPRGTGVFVLAANDVEVTNNTITGNEGTGAAIISWPTVQALGGGSDSEDPGYDPWAERIYIHDNTFENNGTMPGGDGSNDQDPLWQVRALLAGAGVDVSGGLESVLWDGVFDEAGGAVESDVLCLQNNGDATFRDLDAVRLATGDAAADTNTDATPHDCTHDGWGEVDVSWAAFADE